MLPHLSDICKDPFTEGPRGRLCSPYTKDDRIPFIDNSSYLDYTIVPYIIQLLLGILPGLPGLIEVLCSPYGLLLVHRSLVHSSIAHLLGGGLGECAGVFIGAPVVAQVADP